MRHRSPVSLVAALAVAAAACGWASGSAGRGGQSVNLRPVTRHQGCRTRGRLPDPGCNPGARFVRATQSAVCRPGYARRVRDVPTAEKAAVYRQYGLRRRFDGANGELDHLVPLELGGSNVPANLFPEAADRRAGFRQKDMVENALHALVCRGLVGLSEAQTMIARDWTAAARWVDARFPGVSRRGSSGA